MLTCLGFGFLQAQDIIHKKDKSTLEVKILEVGLDEVKYVDFNDQDGIVYVVDKGLISKIQFENGKEEFYTDDFENPVLYAEQRDMALKLDFLSPLFGFTEIGFEKALKPGQTVEFNVGFIGLGTNSTANDSRGAYLSGGYKFFYKPLFFNRGQRYDHILKGKYIKPEIAISAFRHDESLFDSNGNRETTVMGAILLNFGQQRVFSDIFMVDYHVGFGYAFGGDNAIEQGFAFNSFGDSGANFAVSAGLRIGILLK